MSALVFQLKEIIAVKLPTLPAIHATINFDYLFQLAKKMYKKTFIYHFFKILSAPVE